MLTLTMLNPGSYVLDIGQSEDWYALQMALAPCLLGYGQIARRLYDDPNTLRSGNRYWKWIENYVGDDYVEAVRQGSGRSTPCEANVVTNKNFAQRSLNDMHPPSRQIASKNSFRSLFTPHVYVCHCRVTDFWSANGEDVDGDWLLGHGRRSSKQAQVAVTQCFCSSFIDSIDKQKAIRTALTHDSDINIPYKPRLAIHYERGDANQRCCAPLWLMQIHHYPRPDPCFRFFSANQLIRQEPFRRRPFSYCFPLRKNFLISSFSTLR